MGNGRAALYSLPISVVEIHPASPPKKVSSTKDYQVPIPNTQHEFVTPKWPPPQKNTTVVCIFFGGVAPKFFGVTKNRSAVFRNRPKTPIYLKCSFFMKDGRTSIGSTETRETRSSLGPTPRRPQTRRLFVEKFSPSEKIVCHSKKYDFQRNSPRCNALGFNAYWKKYLNLIIWFSPTTSWRL